MTNLTEVNQHICLLIFSGTLQDALHRYPRGRVGYSFSHRFVVRSSKKNNQLLANALFLYAI